MKNEILGTWKSYGVVEKNGSIKKKNAHVAFTFKENGKVEIKFLFFSNDLDYVENNGVYTMQGDDENRSMKVQNGLLYAYSKEGNCVVFKKA